MRRRAPNRELAIRRYRFLARGYDASARFVADARRAALQLLSPREGDIVLDVACGTGLMIPNLAQRVGARGRVIGIEQSPEMIAIAKDRVRREGLGAVVTLIESSAEEVHLEHMAEALLFFYTHDVLQTQKALERVFAHARPGARVVAAGTCLRPEWWAAPLNLWAAWRARRYLTTHEGLLRPWRHLERYCPDFRVVASSFLGTAYVGVGTFSGGLR